MSELAGEIWTTTTTCNYIQYIQMSDAGTRITRISQNIDRMYETMTSGLGNGDVVGGMGAGANVVGRTALDDSVSRPGFAPNTAPTTTQPQPQLQPNPAIKPRDQAVSNPVQSNEETKSILVRYVFPIVLGILIAVCAALFWRSYLSVVQRESELKDQKNNLDPRA